MHNRVSTNRDSALVLTIDIGTSSLRVLAYDRTAHRIAHVEGRRAVTVTSDATGAAEVDTTQLVSDVVACIDDVIMQLGARANDIVAVGMATMATTMVGLDTTYQPVGPLRTYADTRSDDASHTLRAEYAETTVHARTGCLIRPNYWPARLRWLQTAMPAEWQRATHWVPIGGYVAYYFTGALRVTPSEAAWTGLCHRESLQWDDVWLQQLDLHAAMFAQIVDVDVPLPSLGAAWAARWPALAGVPWYGAMGDGAAANVGSGCVDERFLALTVGTTGAMRIALPGTPMPPAGLWCYRIDRQTALVGGATSEGGNVFQWMSDTLRIDGDDATIQHRLGQYRADTHGLTILPLFAGERSPGWAGDAKATIHGLHLGTTPFDLLRASLESIALRFGQIAARLPVTGQVIASGGALEQSPVWMQICADVLGRPVYASGVEEATARGVAVVALRSLGIIPSLAALPTAPTVCYTPDDVAYQAYRRAGERQRLLYERLIAQPLG
jgi:gluconokinase